MESRLAIMSFYIYIPQTWIYFSCHVVLFQSVMKMLNPALSSRDSGYAETMANDLFGQLDRNRNSRISWDEFRDGAMRCSLVVDLLQCAPPGEDDEVFQ